MATRSVGVVLQPNLIATVAHSVAGESEVVVTTRDGRALSGTVVAIDTDADAAIVHVSDLALAPSRSGPYQVGERVQLWTMPGGDARPLVATISRPVEVQTTDIYMNGAVSRPGYEVSSTVVAGDSGSPLVTDDGLVVGIVWATGRDDARSWASDMTSYGALLLRAVPGASVRVPCAR